jgi:hypothetical protein
MPVPDADKRADIGRAVHCGTERSQEDAICKRVSGSNWKSESFVDKTKTPEMKQMKQSLRANAGL